MEQTDSSTKRIIRLFIGEGISARMLSVRVPKEDTKGEERLFRLATEEVNTLLESYDRRFKEQPKADPPFIMANALLHLALENQKMKEMLKQIPKINEQLEQVL